MRALILLPADADPEAVTSAWRRGAPGTHLDICRIGIHGPGFLAALTDADVDRVDQYSAYLASPPTHFLDAATLIRDCGAAALGRALKDIAAVHNARVVVATGPAITVPDDAGPVGKSGSPEDRAVPAGATRADGGAQFLASLATPTEVPLVAAAGLEQPAPAAPSPELLRTVRAAVVGLELVAAVGDDVPLVGMTGLSARQRDAGMDPRAAQHQEQELADYARALSPVAKPWLAEPSTGKPGPEKPGHGRPNPATDRGDAAAQTGRALLPLAGGGAYADHGHSGHGHSGDPSRPETWPGSGAGGGLGYALAALGAPLVPVIDVVADAVGLDERIAAADLVVVWAPKLGAAEMANGITHGAAKRAARVGVPVIVLTGDAQPGRRVWLAAGISAVYEVDVRHGGATDVGARIATVARTWSGM